MGSRVLEAASATDHLLYICHSMLAENMPPTPVVDVQPSESEVRLSKLVRRHVARWAARVRRHVRDSALYTSAWPRDMRQVGAVRWAAERAGHTQTVGFTSSPLPLQIDRCMHAVVSRLHGRSTTEAVVRHSPNLTAAHNRLTRTCTTMSHHTSNPFTP